MNKNGSIQILRGIAAMLVVHVHSMDMASAHAVPVQIRFFNLAHFGACGVDIFFSVSGFILSTVTMNVKQGPPHGALDFLFRRFIRIFPIYWLLSLFFLGIETKHHHFAMSWVVDSYLLLPSLKYPMQVPLMFVGWTLIFEMSFYYLITLNLFFGRRHAVQRTIITILTVLAVGNIVGFHQSVMILIANPMNLDFVFGCLIGLAYAKFGARQTIGTALLLFGTLLLISSLFVGNFNTGIATYVLTGDLSWYRVWVWGLPAAFITAGVVFRSTQMHSDAGRIGIYVGDASYSIYLISGIVLYGYNLIYRYVARLGPDANIALALLTVVAIGLLCYRYVERPLTRILTAKYHRPAVQSAP